MVVSADEHRFRLSPEQPDQNSQLGLQPSLQFLDWLLRLSSTVRALLVRRSTYDLALNRNRLPPQCGLLRGFAAIVRPPRCLGCGMQSFGLHHVLGDLRAQRLGCNDDHTDPGAG
jgi:hypothetical protein